MASQNKRKLPSSRTINRRVVQRLEDFRDDEADPCPLATSGQDPLSSPNNGAPELQSSSSDSSPHNRPVSNEPAAGPTFSEREFSSSDSAEFADGVAHFDIESPHIESDDETVPVADNIFETISLPNVSLTIKLAAIAIFFNLPNTVLNAFLALLRFLGHSVPKDARTIKKTPRDAPKSENFLHLGILKGIKKRLRWDSSFLRNENVIKLNFNIDGVPLYNNSRAQFWPILCMISNTSTITTPFIVSIYSGMEKPPCLHDFLNPFVDDMLDLETNGIDINGKHFSVQINAIICDAPARSFIKSIVGHNGKKGCERCTLAAKKLENRMVYHQVDQFNLRTDSSFRKRSDKLHHNSPRRSPLERLGIDMVSQFPLDYLHLVCLGVMKKLISLWVDDRVHRLSRQNLKTIDHRIKRYAKSFPQEINRKGRSILEFGRWKATEFRSFMLYSGPLILKGILDVDKYNHFIALHTCMKVLLSPSSTVPQVEHVKICLKRFVNNFSAIYGAHHVVYNVHNVVHLADDVLYFQCPLDKISAFPFETYLGRIKKMLRSSRRPLSQLRNRLYEMDNLDSHVSTLSSSKFSDHSALSILSSFIENSPADSICLVNGCEAIEITAITGNFIIGSPLIISKNPNGSYVDYFSSPIPSSLLSSFVVNGKENRNVCYRYDPSTNLKKCILMPFTDNFDEKKFLLTVLLHYK